MGVWQQAAQIFDRPAQKLGQRRSDEGKNVQSLRELALCGCADLARVAAKNPAMAVGAAAGALFGAIVGTGKK